MSEALDTLTPEAQAEKRVEGRAFRPRQAYMLAYCRLLIGYLTTPKVLRAKKPVIRAVQAELERIDAPCPKIAIMERWLQVGVIIDDYPELAQPVEAIADLYDSGQWSPALLIQAAGSNRVASADLAIVAILDLVADMLAGGEFKEMARKKPESVSALLGKCVDARRMLEPVRLPVAKLDVKKLTDDQAIDLIGELMEAKPHLKEPLASVLGETKPQNPPVATDKAAA